jgi:hypothetical protein
MRGDARQFSTHCIEPSVGVEFGIDPKSSSADSRCAVPPLHGREPVDIIRFALAGC